MQQMSSKKSGSRQWVSYGWVTRFVVLMANILKAPLFLHQNGVSLPAAQLSAKMVRYGKFFEKYHGLVSPYGVFPDFPNLTGLFRIT